MPSEIPFRLPGHRLVCVGHQLAWTGCNWPQRGTAEEADTRSILPNLVVFFFTGGVLLLPNALLAVFARLVWPDLGRLYLDSSSGIFRRPFSGDGCVLRDSQRTLLFLSDRRTGGTRLYIFNGSLRSQRKNHNPTWRILPADETVEQTKSYRWVCFRSLDYGKISTEPINFRRIYDPALEHGPNK